jgi:hypothetical protein
MADSWWHSAAEREETSTDWRYTSENTEESGWSAGNQWRSAPWEGNDTGKGEDKSDKFRSCTTLGTKHPLPLDDRKDLLLALFDRLPTSASGPGSFPRAAMGSWTALIVHAAFYILSRVQPSSALRSLKATASQPYEVQYAAEVFFESTMSIYPSVEQRNEIRELLVRHCWENQNVIVDRAISMGFNYTEVQDRALGNGFCRQDSRNGLPPTQAAAGGSRMGLPVSGAPSGRVLRPMNTDEELDHLNKKQRLLELRAAVQRQECEAAAFQSPAAAAAQGPQALAQAATVLCLREAALRAASLVDCSVQEVARELRVWPGFDSVNSCFRFFSMSGPPFPYCIWTGK